MSIAVDDESLFEVPNCGRKDRDGRVAVCSLYYNRERVFLVTIVEFHSLDARRSVKHRLTLVLAVLNVICADAQHVGAQVETKSTRTVDDARLAANRAVKDIEALAGVLERAGRQLTDGRKKKDKLEAELRALELEKERVLRELSQGEYCSQCMKSRTEIEQSGESFSKHLERVNGQRIPASPEAIREKGNDYDSRLAAKRTEVGREAEQNKQLEERQGTDAKRLSSLILHYRDESQSEAKLIEQEEQKLQQALTELTTLYRKTAALRDETNVPATIEKINIELKVLGDAVEYRRRQIEDRKREIVRSIDVRRRDDIARICNAVSPVGDSIPFMLPCGPSLPRPVEAVGWSVDYSNTRVSVKAPLLDLGSLNLEVKSDWYKSEIAVKAGIEALGVAVGIERKTTLNRKGSTMEERPYLDLDPGFQMPPTATPVTLPVITPSPIRRMRPP